MPPASPSPSLGGMGGIAGIFGPNGAVRGIVVGALPPSTRKSYCAAAKGSCRLGRTSRSQAGALAQPQMEVGGGADHRGVVGAEGDGRIAQGDPQRREIAHEALAQRQVRRDTSRQQHLAHAERRAARTVLVASTSTTASWKAPAARSESERSCGQRRALARVAARAIPPRRVARPLPGAAPPSSAR